MPRADPLTRIGRFLAACAALAAAVWLIRRLHAVLLVIVVGAGIAYALEPLVAAFSAGRAGLRPLGITLAYVTVFLSLMLAGVVGLRPVADDMRAFSAALPQYVERLDAQVTAASRGLRRMLPRELQPKEEEAGIGQAILGGLESVVPNLGQYTVRLVGMGELFVSLATGAVLALVISVFVLADPAYLRKQLLRVLPAAVNADTQGLLDEIGVVLGAYVRGQLVIAATVGLIATLGMRVIGIKYALVLGFFTALTQLVPQVGGVIGVIAAVVLAGLQRPASALAVFILYVVLYAFSGHVLAPWVMGKAVKLRPLVVLLVTMAGTVLAGLPGLLLSVPAAAVVKVVWTFFYPRVAARWGLGDAPAPGTTPVLGDLTAARAPLPQGRS